jgi:predicted ATPase/DNA-binding SARP family transcriptional activator
VTLAVPNDATAPTTGTAAGAVSAAPIPVPLTSLIGREHELADIERLLASTRLVTLTGAGGSGKTRLALALAERVAPDYGGVAWVELASLSDPALLTQHVATALGVSEAPGSTIRQSLVGALRDRTLLLVLDNCEHLIDAASDLADLLLRGCPRLTILATSRQALGVSVEAAWLVPLLAVPAHDASLDQLADCDAVRLFVARALAASPGFLLDAKNARAVVSICRRLEGLPLAIELAAARVRVLHPQQIHERLDDAFRLLTSGARTALPRHRTLRGVIEWSHTLLTPNEQRLLARLAVFANGFTLEQAEHICALEEIVEEDVLDLVAGLVDKSLVLVDTGGGEARYRLLETVRQFARERLHASGEEEIIRRRHAEYFLDVAEVAYPNLLGGANDLALVARLELEDGNLRAAAEWCEEDDARAVFTMRFGAALYWLWYVRGHFSEGRQRLEQALAKGVEVPRLERAKALSALGSVMLWQGDVGPAIRASEQAVAMLREEGDRFALTNALMHLGAALALSGDPVGAAPILDESVDHCRMLGSSVLTCICLYWRGLAAQPRGETALARASFEEAIRIGRELCSSAGIGHPLYRLGWLECDAGNFAAAHAHFRESLPRLLELNDRWGMVHVLDGLAFVSLAASQPENAAGLLAAAEVTREKMGVTPPPEWRATHERLLKQCRELLSPAAMEAAAAMGRTMSLAQIAETAMNAPDCEHVEPVHASTGAQAPAQTAPALQVFALGPLRVVRDGETLGIERWGSAKARELLLFLACHPEGCSREQVGVALWPEASSAQLRNVFHVTLHRLRKALDRPGWIVVEGERYRIAAPIALDADIFDKELSAARRELARGADAMERMRAALALYRGDFLAGEMVGDWHLERRDYLARLCVNGLLALGDRLMEAERWQEAADAYRSVLERDPLHEASYRQLMRCLARAGERPQALRLYQRLSDTLRDELATTPAVETVRLYYQLQGGD